MAHLPKAAVWLGLIANPLCAQDLAVHIAYLRAETPRPPVLSNLDPVPQDLGIAGAELALSDTQTTGRFLNHTYDLTVISVPPGGDLAAGARAALAGASLVLLDAPAADLLAIADLPEAQSSLLLNVSAPDEALRSEDCRANVLHLIPETRALSDALMQFLQARQWGHLALITGPKPADQAWAAALHQSASKFGLEIGAEKNWTFDSDLRESTLAEIPRFTQDLPDHDVLLVADPTDDFGRYIENNGWLPRPVMGTHGLHPTAWAPVIEAWGAVQLQNRFEARAKRQMHAEDYAAWLALRAIGEAVTRTRSTDAANLRAYMLGDDFQLDGFKGRGLSFRNWNGQLRQPIALANAQALVTLAPLPGFLHQRNEMDTLGLDAPESACTAFPR
jgi:ABC transporter substrate binding protein (PQQ-dependent alcohol dehydrogenase system)